MLDVPDIDELVFEFGHAIPTEAAVGAVEIQCVYRVIDQAITKVPIFEDFLLRVGLSSDAVVIPVMLFPNPKRSLVALQVQVRKEQRVIRQLPKRILMFGADPRFGRAALDSFAEHRQ